MNALRRPCFQLIQRSYKVNTVSAFTNYYKPCNRLALTNHTSKCLTSAASTQIVGSETEDGSKKFLKKLTNIDNSKTYPVTECMSQSLMAINYHEIFEKFNLPNTFNSWFLITELHVWMLIIRAMTEGYEKGQDGKFMRNCIVEAMWSDVNKRNFQAALITYDEGLMFDDKALAGALWRRFFAMNCDNYENLEIMVKYVRTQIKHLDSLSRHDFTIQPKVKWVNINEV